MYIALVCADDIWYVCTHIPSTSNTRWGSLRLAPIMCVAHCTVLMYVYTVTTCVQYIHVHELGSSPAVYK